MSLINAIKITARAIFDIKQKIGELNNLNTAEKTNLTTAINELEQRINAKSDVNPENVREIVNVEIAKLTNGASAAMDTLAEIEAAFNNKDSQIAGLLNEIGLAKAKNTELENELAAIKAYIGWSERETLEAKINQLIDNGIES